MTARTKDAVGALALRWIKRNTNESSATVRADLRALIAERDAQAATIAELTAALDEAIKEHDSREEGGGYRPPTGPWRAALARAKGDK